ncbi:Major facilitator superfamily domain containing protein [Rhypophila sp. PSN 637]
MAKATTSNHPQPEDAPMAPPPEPPLATADDAETEPYTIFDKRQKALIVVISSIAATFSGFAGNSYFPALPTLSSDFSVSIDLINLTVTSYLLFQGIAPSLWGPISDVKGRRVAYLFTFIVFLGACIGLALAKNYATLLVLRCLQSTGSASTIAIGSGVIGDITTRADRGGVMGVFQAGLLVPVAVAPVIGGALAGSLGWRWIFWFLAIYSGVFLVVLVLVLPETLRSAVGNGSLVPKSMMLRYPLRIYQKRSTIQWAPGEAEVKGQKKSVDLTGPFRILFSKQAAPMMVYTAVYYTVWQMTITAMSTLFKEKYGLSDTQIGLTFIGNGMGSIIGTLVTGKILNMDYKRVMDQLNAEKEKSPAELTAVSSDMETTTDSNETTTDEKGPSDGNNDSVAAFSSRIHNMNAAMNTSTSEEPDQYEVANENLNGRISKQEAPSTTKTKTFPLEKARLPRLPLLSVIQCLSILLFGWSLAYSEKVHISIPILSTFITGCTAVSTLSIATTYLVDIFHDKSAAAGASLNLVRCLLAAGGASFVGPLIGKIDAGWAFTVFVGIQGVAILGLAVQIRWGGAWREEQEKVSSREEK